MFELSVGWSWSVPVLTTEFIGLLVINVLLGFLVARVLRRMFGLGIALIAIIVILSLASGVSGLSYGGVMDSIIPTLIGYGSAIYVLFVQELPWSAGAMLIGFAEGYFGYGVSVTKKN